MKNISPHYLRLKQAAHFLGISRTSFYRLISEGALPEGIRYGGRIVVWRMSDLIEFAEAKAKVDPFRAFKGDSRHTGGGK